MSDETLPAPSRDYTAEQVEVALIHLATYRSPRKAERDLGIGESLLRYWRDHSHHARYLEIARRQAPQVEQAAIESLKDTITKAAEIQQAMLDDYAEQHTRLDPRDKAAAIKAIAQTKATDIDRLQLLQGKPTQITDTRTAAEILRSIASKLPVHVESTAEDITPT